MTDEVIFRVNFHHSGGKTTSFSKLDPVLKIPCPSLC